ncbi:MAG: anhydro-N-acetylmuramic acid kinase [Pseudomonadota bacterium]
MKTELYLGAISGTSLDGLDLALIEVEPAASSAGKEQVRHRAGTTVPFPPALRRRLEAQTSNRPVSLDEFGHLDTALGSFIAECSSRFLAANSLRPEDICAIGSHGQTLRHQPPSTGAQEPFTLQIGNPHQIVEQTGITTVADFRGRDLAAGGEGAPLAPLYHEALFATADERRWVLNLGGIANLTRLYAGAPLIGFDTGPANALIDAWCAAERDAPFDVDGRWAATGSVQQALLDQCLADPYFELPPPKSTGKERFNLEWIAEQLSRLPALAPADVQRTLVELTAVTVVEAIPDTERTFDRLLVCGGGRHNRVLMERLSALCPTPVEDCGQHGADGDSLEAGIFAWLAFRCLHEVASPTGTVTGAQSSRVLGVRYPAG